VRSFHSSLFRLSSRPAAPPAPAARPRPRTAPAPGANGAPRARTGRGRCTAVWLRFCPAAAVRAPRGSRRISGFVAGSTLVNRPPARLSMTVGALPANPPLLPRHRMLGVAAYLPSQRLFVPRVINRAWRRSPHHGAICGTPLTAGRHATATSVTVAEATVALHRPARRGTPRHCRPVTIDNSQGAGHVDSCALSTSVLACMAVVASTAAVT